MITINLLPYGLRPVKRTPLPYILSGTATLLTLCVIFLVFLKSAGEIDTATRILNDHKNELDTLKPVVEEYNALAQKKVQLAEQVTTISEIASDRIIWSRQLHNLNRLALENMWYENIDVALKPFTETRTVFNEKNKTYETITERIDRNVLTLTGYVIPGEDGMSSVSPFTLITENDPEFSQMFQLELSTFKDTTFDGINVREFKLEYVIGEGGTEQ